MRGASFLCLTSLPPSSSSLSSALATMAAERKETPCSTPALAGIASELQMIWHDTYLAGMWKSCFVTHLGWWGAWRPYPRLRGSYTAPLWSWASFPGAVSMPEVAHEDAEVVDCMIIPLHQGNPLGKVRHARLTLQTKLIQGNRSVSMCCVDYETSHYEVFDHDTKFLLLGSSEHGAFFGLIISPVGDGTYMRVGQCWISEDLWSAQNAERQVVTII